MRFKSKSLTFNAVMFSFRFAVPFLPFAASKNASLKTP